MTLTLLTNADISTYTKKTLNSLFVALADKTFSFCLVMVTKSKKKGKN